MKRRLLIALLLLAQALPALPQQVPSPIQVAAAEGEPETTAVTTPDNTKLLLGAGIGVATILGLALLTLLGEKVGCPDGIGCDESSTGTTGTR